MPDKEKNIFDGSWARIQMLDEDLVKAFLFHIINSEQLAELDGYEKRWNKNVKGEVE